MGQNSGIDTSGFGNTAVGGIGSGGGGGGELSLGGAGGVQQPGGWYNQITGKYETYGGNQGGATYEEKPEYKQHLQIGSGQGAVWLPPDVAAVDYFANPTDYQTVSNANNGKTVISGANEQVTGAPEYNGENPTGTGGGDGTGGTGGTGGGGGGTGGGGGDDGIDWDLIFGPGGEDAPQPKGGRWQGGKKVPKDTSWNWDHFKPKAPGDAAWGGYDDDYQAFERYQPGMDSPWGMPNIAGGNENFYQQQFVNQLRDEQGFRNRQRGAQKEGQFAARNPFEAAEMDWSWANNGKGLGQAVTSTGIEEDLRPWALSSGFDKGMTNADVFQKARGWNSWSDEEQGKFDSWMDPEGDQKDSGFLTGTNWANVKDPSVLLNNLGKSENGLSGDNRDFLTKIINGMYSRQGAAGPGTPAGYAAPLASYESKNVVNPTGA